MGIKSIVRLIGRVYTNGANIATVASGIASSVLSTQHLICTAARLLDGATEDEKSEAKSALKEAMRHIDRTIIGLSQLRSIIER